MWIVARWLRDLFTPKPVIVWDFETYEHAKGRIAPPEMQIRSAEVKNGTTSL